MFVLSTTLNDIPPSYKDKAQLVSGELSEIVATLNQNGFEKLYIDGGRTVQSFLAAGLIDELIVTQIPVLLGGGFPLFGELTEPQSYELVKSDVLLNAMVKNHYRRRR